MIKSNAHKYMRITTVFHMKETIKIFKSLTYWQYLIQYNQFECLFFLYEFFCLVYVIVFSVREIYLKISSLNESIVFDG